MDQLLSALPLLAAAAATGLIAAFRNHVMELVPDHWIPVLLPVCGGLLATIARALGADLGDFNSETADLTAWQTAVAGILTGLATVGLHQAQKQIRERPTDRLDD